MTDTAILKPPPVAKLSRKPSAKTLAKQLAKFLDDHKGGPLKPTSTVKDLMIYLSSVIVDEEVGRSLNDWITPSP